MSVFADEGKYITAVKKALADKEAFDNFKKDSDYQEILEHVSYKNGQQYLDILCQQAPDFVEKINTFKINDVVGNPLTFEYKNIGFISPTTLRYIKVASDLRTLFGDLSGLTIAEIGIGYGGQVLVLDQVWSTNYLLVDLIPVLCLAEKYLDNRLQKTKLINNFNNLDLVISNYAFSELPKPIQNVYIRDFLSKAKRGYLTMNGINGYTIDELKLRLPKFDIIEENPKTGPNNCIIKWG